MPRITSPARDRRLMPSIAATALAVAAISAAGGSALAAPTVRAVVDDGTLRISGSPFAERIALRLDAADPNRLQLDVGDDASADRSFDLGTFDAILVRAGGGDDAVRIDQANGAFTATETTRIEGGHGDDTLLGGSGAETFIGGPGDDLVDGNGGADTAFLGRGDDVFVWDPGDGSDVVEGQRGSDTMVFNGAAGSEIMAATADAGRVSFTRNLGNIVMDLDGIESIDVRALGGADEVAVGDVRGTDLRRVLVDLAGALEGASSDGAADEVSVLGTKGDDAIAVEADGSAVEVAGLAASVRIANADAALDGLVLDTLGGDDDVVVDAAVTPLIEVDVL